jgi:hypothetical protein
VIARGAVAQVRVPPDPVEQYGLVELSDEDAGWPL